MADREPRQNETRETSTRTKSWERPTNLPTPAPREGVTYRWIRTSTLGNADNTNVSSKFREGWTPVKAEDHPELKVLPDIDTRLKVTLRLEDCFYARTQPIMLKAESRLTLT